MLKVKTFSSELKVFHTMNELSGLDEQVNKFIEENGVKKLVSVNDVCTTNDSGATMGIIRVVAYEEP